MQLTRLALAGLVAAGLLAGCAQGTGYDENPAGKDAGKTNFTQEDARAAQPARRGSEGE